MTIPRELANLRAHRHLRPIPRGRAPLAPPAHTFPRALAVTYSSVGIRVALRLSGPPIDRRDVAAIARDALRIQRPDVELARFDWLDATVLAHARDRFTIRARFRLEGAAATTRRPR